MSYILSVITVTRNCEKTIARTLESVRKIKCTDIEYIVVDGASTDSTISIVGQFHDVIDTFISERDNGIYDAMNKGAALAKGEYVLFLNGDDYLLSDGFKNALSILRNERPEILSCRSEVISEAGESLRLLQLSTWRLIFFNTVPHLSTFVRTELQRKYRFRGEFKIAADYDLFLRLLLDRHPFSSAGVTIATHFRGGFSSNISQSILECRKIRRVNLGVVIYVVTRMLEEANQLVNSALNMARRAFRCVKGSTP